MGQKTLEAFLLLSFMLTVSALTCKKCGLAQEVDRRNVACIDSFDDVGSEECLPETHTTDPVCAQLKVVAKPSESPSPSDPDEKTYIQRGCIARLPQTEVGHCYNYSVYRAAFVHWVQPLGLRTILPESVFCLCDDDDDCNTKTSERFIVDRPLNCKSCRTRIQEGASPNVTCADKMDNVPSSQCGSGEVCASWMVAGEENGASVFWYHRGCHARPEDTESGECYDVADYYDHFKDWQADKDTAGMFCLCDTKNCNKQKTSQLGAAAHVIASSLLVVVMATVTWSL